MFLKTPKFGMQQKAHIFISGLTNLNSFHILTRDTKRNHLRPKKMNFWGKNIIFEQNNVLIFHQIQHAASRNV